MKYARARFAAVLIFVFFWSTLAVAGVDQETARLEGRLENGIRYAIVRDQTVSKTADLYFIVEAGALQQSRSQVEYAHLLEHLLVSEASDPGTSGFSGASLLRYWQGKNPKGWHAQTGLKSTFVKIPVDLDHVPIARPLALFRSYLNFRYSIAAAQREGAAIISEGRKGGDLWYEMADRAEREAPWLGYSPSDIERSMRHISLEQLGKFHANWYRPEFIRILIRGDVDAKQAKVAIEEAFGAVPRRRRAPKRITPFEAPKFSAALVRSEKLDRVTVKVLFREDPILAKRDTVFDDALSAQMAVRLFGLRSSGFTRRYNAAMDSLIADFVPSQNGVGSELRLQAVNCLPEAVRDCLDQIMDVLSSVASRPATDLEMVKLKSYADEHTQATSDDWSSYFEPAHVRDSSQHVTHHSPTPETIKNAFASLWRQSARRVEIFAPLVAKLPDRARIQAITAPNRTANPVPVAALPRPSGLTLNVATPIARDALSVDWQTYDAIDIAKVWAPNHVPVFLAFPRERDSSGAELSISALSAVGINSLPAELRASGNHFSQLLASNGVGGLNRFEFDEFAGANQLTPSVYAGPFNVFLSVRAADRSPARVELAGRLLASLFRLQINPNAASDFARHWAPAQQSQALIAGISSSSSQVASKNISHVAEAYRNLIHNPAEFIFLISGSLGSEREDIVRRLGGYLVGAASSPKKSKSTEVVIPSDIRITGLNNVQVYVKWAVPEVNKDLDYDRVDQALTQILSARLFAKLRGELSAAYGVSFGASNSSAPPLFAATAQFDAQDARVDDLVSTTIAEFAEFARRGPSTQEMLQIKQLAPPDRTRSSLEFFLRGDAPPPPPVEPTAEALMERASLLTRKNAQVITVATVS